MERDIGHSSTKIFFDKLSLYKSKQASKENYIKISNDQPIFYPECKFLPHDSSSTVLVSNAKMKLTSLCDFI